MNNFSFNIENNYTLTTNQIIDPTKQLIGHYETTIMWISLILFITIISSILINKKNITEYLQAASAGISWVLVYLLTITTYGANSHVYKGLVYGWIIIIIIIVIYKYLEWKKKRKQ